jgi:hypothetical protein
VDQRRKESEDSVIHHIIHFLHAIVGPKVFIGILALGLIWELAHAL